MELSNSSESFPLVYFYLNSVDTLLDAPVSAEIRKQLSSYLQFTVSSELIEKASVLKLVASVYVKAMRTGGFEYWSEALCGLLDSCKLRDANKVLALRCLKLLVAANDPVYKSILTGEKVSNLLTDLINENNSAISGKAAKTAICLFDPTYLFENDHYIQQVVNLQGSNPAAYLKCVHSLTASPLASTYPKVFVTRLHLDSYLQTWKNSGELRHLGVLCEILREVGGWLIGENEWTLGGIVVKCGLRCMEVRENGCVWDVVKLLKQVIERLQRELERNVDQAVSESQMEMAGEIYVHVIRAIREYAQEPGTDEYFYQLKLSALAKLLLSLPFSQEILLHFLINSPTQLQQALPGLISLLQLQDSALRKHSTQLLMSLLQANTPGSPICLILRELLAVLSEADMLLLMTEVRHQMGKEQEVAEFDRTVVDFVGLWKGLNKRKSAARPRNLLK